MACNLTSFFCGEATPDTAWLQLCSESLFFDGAENDRATAAVSGRGGDDVGASWVTYCNSLMAPPSAWGEDGGDRVVDMLMEVGG